MLYTLSVLVLLVAVSTYVVGFEKSITTCTKLTYILVDIIKYASFRIDRILFRDPDQRPPVSINMTRMTRPTEPMCVKEYENKD